MEIIDYVGAWSVQVNDQILIQGDPVEVKQVIETDDPDEIVVKGYSHDTGDSVEYALFADDMFEVWSA